MTITIDYYISTDILTAYMAIERIRFHFQELGKSLGVGPEPTELSAEEEQKKNKYLETLSEVDQKNVRAFLDFIQEMSGRFKPTQIVVTAVGSSTKPENMRQHPVRDIDLRILNSEKTGSDARLQVIYKIRGEIQEYLQKAGIPFEEDNCTIETLMIPVQVVDEKTGKVTSEVSPYVNWYNEDPSFVTQAGDDGKPLHISISGLGNYPLRAYLRKERKKMTTTVILTR